VTRAPSRPGGRVFEVAVRLQTAETTRRKPSFWAIWLAFSVRMVREPVPTLPRPMMPRWTSRINDQDSSEPSAKKAKPTAEERRAAEHAEARKGVERLRALARELREELEEKKYHALSLKALDRLEGIEKLSREVRGRLRR